MCVCALLLSIPSVSLSIHLCVYNLPCVIKSFPTKWTHGFEKCCIGNRQIKCVNVKIFRHMFILFRVEYTWFQANIPINRVYYLHITHWNSVMELNVQWSIWYKIDLMGISRKNSTLARLIGHLCHCQFGLVWLISLFRFMLSFWKA